MITSPAGISTKNDCAVEAQDQFTRSHSSSQNLLFMKRKYLGYKEYFTQNSGRIINAELEKI
jgi:hypothetical protein